ncbi:MAG: formamidopyrimidine-DNA glycosylase [Deltaproteobacteria bacterium]|nr:formamidopyrimidine-DNA glycosylase [Deltaproteobacteria bacterium]MBK8236980.1 formamidopyrimidine-DNA glycosylase [Deltaproteobacteria bacterium]MBK8719191.1 formamidopyrimidine-DNA glycosylase [Deltaproteobacteria bacterium]MBP7290872.1 formamidopyrimidine-DNA glycosylase [Nannocystaceae bacterium]
MPELPDITVYVERLADKLKGATLEVLRLCNPFFLRTVTPPWQSVQGCRVQGVSRLGKRIAISLEGELHLVMHLMKLGRLKWDARGKAPGLKLLHASLTFDRGSLHVIEIGPKKRASLHVVKGDGALAEFRPLGIEPLACTLAEFTAAVRRENHTLKRTLTDQRLIAGIGNAYSDEILHAARLSPVQLSTKLDDDAIARLWQATRATLDRWTDQLRAEVGDGFPEKVTAFREGMAVHGRFREPCPVCQTAVERIVYADRETNYCARCQTDGKRLADRALSRLLGQDWPRTLEELEERRG